MTASVAITQGIVDLGMHHTPILEEQNITHFSWPHPNVLRFDDSRLNVVEELSNLSQVIDDSGSFRWAVADEDLVCTV